MSRVWSEPKFVAQVKWHEMHPDPIQQIFAQLGSLPASKSGGSIASWLHKHADETVTVQLHEPPDWDWWEPRHDQPWRRKQARDREAGL